jgi:hypothetical protein
MIESSQGTAYNVETDVAKWARVKIELLTPEQREALRREFARLDREEHGRRVLERSIRNGG